MEFIIRDYLDADYQQLFELLKECGLYNPLIDRRESLRRKVESSPGSIVVAEIDDCLVGCCYVVLDPTLQYVLHLGVSNQCRGHGIGKALIAEIEQRIKDFEPNSAPLFWVEEDNKQALKLYEQLGYKLYDQKRYVLMTKNLKSN